MSVANGFPRILGVFYSIFDVEQGSRPLAQVPDGAIKSTPTSQVPQPFVSFDAIKNYIIPKPALCNRLVSVLYKGYRVIGHPVNVVGERYERNSFTFNLAFIFPADVDTSPYESVISRTANMFKALEEQSCYLSDRKNIIAVDSAMEQMFQDLNSFSECQIPIDPSNKLDIKLFPILDAPPVIHGYNVPVATVRVSGLIDETWDPTLEKLIPYINGVNSVRRIADLAEADYDLTRRGIQHLVHYGCVVILDIFQFSNMYGASSTVTDICDPHVYGEFRDYVYREDDRLKRHRNMVRSKSDVSTPLSVSSLGETYTMLSMKQVFQLYTSFFNGLSLGSWYYNNRDLLRDIDLNRFLAFGVLKRLIYRVFSYPLRIPKRNIITRSRVDEALEANGLDGSGIDVILNTLETPRHFDSLCTDLRANRATVGKVLRSLSDWAVANR